MHVVNLGDSSRDLVNELIHHSFISEVRPKTVLFSFLIFIFAKIKLTEAVPTDKCSLFVQHLAKFDHHFSQEDGDKIVTFLEDALNRHRGSTSAITTI